MEVGIFRRILENTIYLIYMGGKNAAVLTVATTVTVGFGAATRYFSQSNQYANAEIAAPDLTRSRHIASLGGNQSARVIPQKDIQPNPAALSIGPPTGSVGANIDNVAGPDKASSASWRAPEIWYNPGNFRSTSRSIATPGQPQNASHGTIESPRSNAWAGLPIDQASNGASSKQSLVATTSAQPASTNTGSGSGTANLVPSATHSSISATGPRIADGSDSSSVTVIFKDANQIPLSGITPSLTATGSSNSIACGATDASGTATCAFRTTKAESKIISFTSPTDFAALSATVSFVAGPPAQIAFTTQPSSGGTSTQVLAQQPTVQIRDAQGNDVNMALAVSLAAHTASDCSAGSVVPGTLSMTTNPVTSSAGSGAAAFGGVKYDRPGTIYLKASLAAGATACSNGITLANNSPVLSLPSNRVYPIDGASPPILQGQSSAYSFTATATDADAGQSLSFSCIYETPGLSASDPNYAAPGTVCTALPSLEIASGYIQPNTASFTTTASSATLAWIPTSTQRGTYKFTITVQDDYSSSASASGSFYVSVRENYSTANLLAALDATYGWDGALTNAPSTPKAPTTAYNTNSGSWLGLFGSFSGILSSFMGTTAPWAGAGTATNPYQLQFNGSSDSLSLGSVMGANDRLMFSTWINASAPSTLGSIILGNGGGSGNGFVLKQGAVSPNAGKIELSIGSTPPSHSQLVLGHSPIGYWRLDEVSGLSASDASSNGVTGTYSGSGVTLGASGALSVFGDNDAAAGFDGSAGYVGLPLVSSATTNFTISLWVYTSAPSQTNGLIFYSGNPAGNGYGLMLSNGACAAGNVVSLLLGGITCNGVSATYALPANTWVHLVLTRDATGSTLYANGVAVASGLATPITPTNGSGIGGSYNGAAGHFNGTIDDVAFFGTALSAAQVYALYRNSDLSTCRSQTSLAANTWSMVSGIWDGSTVSLFLNGRQECSRSLSGASIASPVSTTTIVGASPTASNRWTGAIADLKLHGTSNGASPGTTADIQTTFHATANRFRAVSVPDIASNGLILNLDASNANTGLSAYPNGDRANSTWHDLAQMLQATVSWGTASSWENPYSGAADLYLDGSNGTYVTLPSSLSIPVNTQISVELWAYIKSSDIGSRVAFTIGGMDSPNRFMASIPWSDGNVYWDYGNWTTTGRQSYAGTAYRDKWSHIVLVSKGSGGNYKAIYIDGQVVASSNASDGPAQALSGGYIGQFANNYFLKGRISTFRIYNRVLSPAEISQNCRAQVSRYSGAACN